MDKQAMMGEIQDLVSVLDPDKIRKNSNRALDMLADRGLTDIDILRMEIVEVIHECIRQVVSFDDLFFPAPDRFIATNQRDGASHEPAEIFSQRCLSLLEERKNTGLARAEVEMGIQQDLAPLIKKALYLRDPTYAESRILYPGAGAAHLLRRDNFLALFPDVNTAVRNKMGEIQQLHFYASREAPTAHDREELFATREFVFGWIMKKFFV